MAGSGKRDLRDVLTYPLVYESFQRIVGKNKLRRRLVTDYIRPLPGERLLDIGCGPGDLAPFLAEVEYHGYDVSAEYIDSARRRYGRLGRFYEGDLEQLASDLAGTCDHVVMLGVLHHVDDATARHLVDVSWRALTPGGLFHAVEPHTYKGQNPVAKWLIDRDRGEFVRPEESYADIISESFDVVSVAREERMLRIPYTNSVYSSVKGASSASDEGLSPIV